jgi:hypothetical protein
MKEASPGNTREIGACAACDGPVFEEVVREERETNWDYGWLYWRRVPHVCENKE